jgi:hypothetical protein
MTCPWIWNGFATGIDHHQLAIKCRRFSHGVTPRQQFLKHLFAITAEVRSRLERGQFGFLPEQSKGSEDRVFLEADTRFIELPNVDADQIAAGNVLLAFVLPGPVGYQIEIIWRAQ